MRLKDIGERGVIDLIRKSFPAPPDNVLLGIGDDAASVRAGGNVLVTKDLLAEGYDFVAGLHPPELLGRKALNVNLSDIAAMGGRPLYAVLGLGLPRATDLDWLKAFLAGFRRAARKAGVSLVGGDLSQASSIMISVTVIGEAETAVTRSGARPGDRIFVSGTVGDAAAGLALFETGARPGRGRDEDRLLKAFLDPAPRLELGTALAAGHLASAMIDVSDGLSVDLAHIAEASGVAAEIELGAIPLSEALRRRSKDPLAAALHGGEDFELLFTVRPRNVRGVFELGKRFRVTAVGRITPGKGLVAIDARGRRKPLPVRGYEHFRPKRGA
jgi:thiamine-monophosphate kinase